jgi:hypothetical protein
MQQFSDRVLSTWFPLSRDQIVRVRMQVRFSNVEHGNLARDLTSMVSNATAFSAHDFTLNPDIVQRRNSDAQRMDLYFRSPGNAVAIKDNWYDLAFEGNSRNSLRYDVLLARETNISAGTIHVKLERRASIFTRDVVSTSAPNDARVPNYHRADRGDARSAAFIWTEGRLSPDVSPSSYFRDRQAEVLTSFQAAGDGSGRVRAGVPANVSRVSRPQLVGSR